MSAYIFLFIYACNQISNLHGITNYDLYKSLNTNHYNVGKRQDSLHMYYWNKFKPIKNNGYPLIKTIVTSSSNRYNLKPPMHNYFYNFVPTVNYHPIATPINNYVDNKSQYKNFFLPKERSPGDMYAQYYNPYNFDYPDIRIKKAIPMRVSKPLNSKWNSEQHGIVLPYVYPLHPLLINSANKLINIPNSNSFDSVGRINPKNIKNTTIRNLTCGIQQETTLISNNVSRTCFPNIRNLPNEFKEPKLSIESPNQIITPISNNRNPYIKNEKSNEVQIMNKENLTNYSLTESSHFPLNPLTKALVNYNTVPLKKLENYETDTQRESLERKVEKNIENSPSEKPFYMNKLINNKIVFMPITSPYIRGNSYYNHSTQLSRDKNAYSGANDLADQFKIFKNAKPNTLLVRQPSYSDKMHDFFTLDDAVTSISTPSRKVKVKENKQVPFHQVNQDQVNSFENTFKANYVLDTLYNNEDVNYDFIRNRNLQHFNKSLNLYLNQSLESTTILPLISTVAYTEGYKDANISSKSAQIMLDDFIKTTTATAQTSTTAKATTTTAHVATTIDSTNNSTLQSITTWLPILKNPLTPSDKLTSNTKPILSLTKKNPIRDRIRGVNVHEFNNKAPPEKITSKIFPISMKNNTSLYARQRHKYIKKMKHVKNFFLTTTSTTTTTITTAATIPTTTTSAPISLNPPRNFTASNHRKSEKISQIEDGKMPHTRRRTNKYNTNWTNNNTSLKVTIDDNGDQSNKMLSTNVNTITPLSTTTINFLYSNHSATKNRKIRRNNSKVNKRHLSKLHNVSAQNSEIPPLPIEMYFEESKKRRIFNK